MEEREFEELINRPDAASEEFSTDWEEIIEEKSLLDRWARWADSVDR